LVFENIKYAYSFSCFEYRAVNLGKKVEEKGLEITKRPWDMEIAKVYNPRTSKEKNLEISNLSSCKRITETDGRPNSRY
jgi:hypothetical protein